MGIYYPANCPRQAVYLTPHSGPATIDVLLKYHASASLPYKPRAAEVLAGLAAIAQTQSEAARG